jgi:hypothetical protein
MDHGNLFKNFSTDKPGVAEIERKFCGGNGSPLTQSKKSVEASSRGEGNAGIKQEGIGFYA